MYKKNYLSYFLKVFLLLILIIYIFSIVKFSQTFFDKNELNNNQINEIKYFNDLYKYQIAKLENELNSMKNINLEYSNLLKKALLTDRKEFEQNLLNKINKVYTKNKVVNINEVESSIKLTILILLINIQINIKRLKEDENGRKMKTKIMRLI